MYFANDNLEHVVSVIEKAGTADFNSTIYIEQHMKNGHDVYSAFITDKVWKNVRRSSQCYHSIAAVYYALTHGTVHWRDE